MTPARLTDEELRARARRNVAIALALAGFVVLLFVITVVQLKGDVANWGSAF